MKKLLMILIFSMFFISLTSAITYKQDQVIQLTGVCDNCTQMNLTKVTYPNGSFALLGEYPMDKDGTNYNYSFSDTSTFGKYVYSTCGDLNGILTCDDTTDRTFEITPNGETPDMAKGIMFLVAVVMLIIFFSLAIYGIVITDHYIGKFVFYWIAHFLMVAITFIIWNMATNFLTGFGFIIGFFRILWWIVFISIFPMILISLAWIFYIHTMGDDVRNMVDKGMPVEEAFSRSAKKRYF